MLPCEKALLCSLPELCPLSHVKSEFNRRIMQLYDGPCGMQRAVYLVELV